MGLRWGLHWGLRWGLRGICSGGRVGHVDIMIFVLVLFTLGTQRKRSFWWNTGFHFLTKRKPKTHLAIYCLIKALIYQYNVDISIQIGSYKSKDEYMGRSKTVQSQVVD